MARPAWKLTTDDEREAIAAVERAAAAVQRLNRQQDRAEAALTEAIRAARALDISADVLAPVARIGRATLFRRLAGPPDGP
jgi:hypothetical protein